MFRRIMAAVAPGAFLIVLALVLEPFDLGYLGLLLFAASLLLAAAGAFLVRQDPEDPETPETRTWRVALLVTATLATGIIWFRVWSYDSWHISVMPIPFIYAFGFWWPGLLLASSAWALAGSEVERSLRRYLSTLGIGLAAGVVGAGVYQSSQGAYFIGENAVPIETAVSHVTGSVPGKVDWSLRMGALNVVVYCDWATEASPYTVYACLSRMAKGADTLLKRQDVKEISIQASAASNIVFSTAATDESPHTLQGWLDRLDRSALKDGGLLDTGSLEEMVYAEPPEFVHDENAQLFEQAFKFGATDDEVTITFAPTGPLSGANVDLYAAAYRAANRIVRETAVYFPDIERFQVDLAGFRRTVSRDEAAVPSFFLQDQLTPRDSVLGLITKVRASTTASLDPAAFRPSDPLDANQIAAVVTLGKMEEQCVGRLFEEIPLRPGRLYLTELKPDGTVTAFVIPEQGEPAGPIDVRPGEEGLAADQWITNLGFIPRTDFPLSASQ